MKRATAVREGELGPVNVKAKESKLTIQPQHNAKERSKEETTQRRIHMMGPRYGKVNRHSSSAIRLTPPKP